MWLLKTVRGHQTRTLPRLHSANHRLTCVVRTFLQRRRPPFNDSSPLRPPIAIVMISAGRGQAPARRLRQLRQHERHCVWLYVAAHAWLGYDTASHRLARYRSHLYTTSQKRARARRHRASLGRLRRRWPSGVFWRRCVDTYRVRLLLRACVAAKQVFARTSGGRD